MTGKGASCKGVNTSGEPCSAPRSVIGPDGYCPAHGPTGRETMAELGRKGAEAVAARRAKGLAETDLPPLTSHEAAETWTDRIGRAAATGALPASAAQAALRAVKEWREAHAAGAVTEKLDALTDALADWRRTGDPAAVLKLVPGGKDGGKG